MRPGREWDGVRVGVLGLCIALTALATWRLPAARSQVSAAAALSTDLPVYAGGLAPGWQDWSWAKHSLRASGVTFQRQAAIRMDPAGWAGLFLRHDAFSTAGYTALAMWVHGGVSGGQRISVCAVGADGKFGVKDDLAANLPSGRITAGKWSFVVMPLRRLGARNTRITGISLQDGLGRAQGSVYFANIRFVGAPAAPPKPYTVSIDTSRDVRPISPLIYGMANANAEYLRDLRLGSNRWGGNPNTRYNWERGNCWNAAHDWEFRNGNYSATSASDRLPSGVADRFVATNRAAGAATVLTIPTIGWVARDDNPESRSLNTPSAGGPPVKPGSEAIAGYDPAENQRRTSVRSFARKGRPFQFPPDLTDGAVFQDEWVDHLVRRFGKSSEGGVRFYAMDNEPDLWDGTHIDIHPVSMSYDMLLANFVEYASAVKAVDPSAQVTGPVSWGWTGYFHSPRDRGKWNERPDRRAHGDTPLIPWFLSAVRAHDKRTGERLLDVLDIHFYPQANGVYGGQTDAQAQAVRLRSTRALWDAAYRDESWIRGPVMLIPRMKAWIARYYPGTRLGLTEWNWGADGTINGGLAVAECLGLFGREGLDLANYWTTPSAKSPGYFAFKIYRNADGQGHGFGDRSVRAVSSAPDDISCFASLDSQTGQPVAMVINKRPDRSADVTLSIRHRKPLTRASLWRYSGADPAGIVALEESRVAGGTLKLSVPAYSITLVRLR